MTDVPMRFADVPLLWTVDDVYTPAECAAFIERIEAGEPSIATNNPLYRNQDRVIFDDPATAEDLFQRLEAHLPAKIGELDLVGLNERLRCYRYQRGQRFAEHMDHWYRPTPNRITLLTILVYFNASGSKSPDDFEGGETRFTEQLEELVVPRPGLVAISQHKIRHEGCEVRRGTKYALRTDVVYEAPTPIRLTFEEP
ncbi:MAG: 2OG-Fe(II) oxygenase [Planctomycetes bacterium]|nr:2OG-Fe(II) oxygenase [Planctomycetota bacterium]